MPRAPTVITRFGRTESPDPRPSGDDPDERELAGRGAQS